MHRLYATTSDYPPHPSIVPVVLRICLPIWLTLRVGSNNRGHFRFSHESFKRCFEKKGQVTSHCYFRDGLFNCYLKYFEEVGCTWRQVPVEPEATESAATPVATTLVEVNRPRIPSSGDGALTSTIA